MNCYLIIIQIALLCFALFSYVMYRIKSKDKSKDDSKTVASKPWEPPKVFDLIRVLKDGRWINITGIYIERIFYDKSMIELRVYPLYNKDIIEFIKGWIDFTKLNTIMRGYDNKEIISNYIYEVERIETTIYFNKESIIHVYYSRDYKNLEEI